MPNRRLGLARQASITGSFPHSEPSRPPAKPFWARRKIPDYLPVAVH